MVRVIPTQTYDNVTCIGCVDHATSVIKTQTVANTPARECIPTDFDGYKPPYQQGRGG